MKELPRHIIIATSCIPLQSKGLPQDHPATKVIGASKLVFKLLPVIVVAIFKFLLQIYHVDIFYMGEMQPLIFIWLPVFLCENPDCNGCNTVVILLI